MKLTYFVHSTSIDNEAGVRSGWQDAPLSETGLAQAHALREQVADRTFTAVFASDLQRAAHTARLVFPGHNIILDQRLREMNYGALNGRSSAHFPSDETRCIHHRFPNGENCLDVEARVREFLGDYARQFQGQHIAIVSHRYPQLALEVVCNGRSWPQAIDNDWRRYGQWQPGWTYIPNLEEQTV
jgi:broad specificity phosphatase PhoE